MKRRTGNVGPDTLIGPLYVFDYYSACKEAFFRFLRRAKSKNLYQIQKIE